MDVKKTGKVRMGVIGAGGFGLFALQHFTQHSGVELVGMAGTQREAAFAVAQRFGIPDIEDVDKLLARADIDLVYIATPPFLHGPQGLKALRAGKHVICEKPLAMTPQECDELIAVAAEKHLLIVANLMQRYNPLYETIRRLIESKALGELLHAYFENYASDEGLPAEHWFWDRSRSGGIFIEHGVHFFDLFTGWLGPGRVVAGQRTLRPGTDLEEQVHCTVRYGNGALVNFYHGFTQPMKMDRQEFRLCFERGDVALEEWVPLQGRVRAMVNERQTRELMELFPNGRLDVIQLYGGKHRAAKGRGQSLDLYQRIEIHFGHEHDKMVRYGEMLRAMFRDQVQWIYDRSHWRKVTEVNGRDSLVMAAEAKRLAELSS